jgi:hypothetical protein
MKSYQRMKDESHQILCTYIVLSILIGTVVRCNIEWNSRKLVDGVLEVVQVTGITLRYHAFQVVRVIILHC